LQLDAERYDMLTLGEEVLAPYAQPHADGTPQFVLPGHAQRPLPYLGYAPGAYLGGVTDWLLQQAGTPIHLDRVYETDMAEGLKAMALAGHGVAFLPLGAVRKELQAGQLVPALSDAGLLPELRLQLRMYRARPGPKSPAKRSAQALWEALQGAASPRLSALAGTP
jgi:DNA-binding transcriptional LysR family regulator